MRAHCIVLLVFLAGISVVSALRQLNQVEVYEASVLKSSSPPALTHGKDVAASSRLLSSFDATGMDEASSEVEGAESEEKAGFPPLKYLDNLVVNFAIKIGVKPEEFFIAQFREGVVLKKLLKGLTYAEKYRIRTGGDRQDTEDLLFSMVSKSTPHEALVPLFLSLRKVEGMENLADKMQRMTMKKYPSTQKQLNDELLKTEISPADVFKRLRIDTKIFDDGSLLVQWLRYTEMYRFRMGKSSFSEWDALQLMQNARTSDVKLSTVFQRMKEVPDLERVAQEMETILFKKLMNKNNITPKVFGDLLTSSLSNTLKLSKIDSRYGTMKAYTLQFTEEYGGPTALKKVKELFAHDPNALKAALEFSDQLDMARLSAGLTRR